ncbi:MAG: hypothetical protein HKP37_03335 [Boseongicola sp.]|nr:hypothetical protein [Boseongicola sp.]
MDISKGHALARAAYESFVNDVDLMTLHNFCNAAHQARIDALNADPAFRERRAEIVKIATEQKTPPTTKGADSDATSDTP